MYIFFNFKVNNYEKDTTQILRYNNAVSIDYEHLKLKDVGHFNDFIDPVASKTIYALHFTDGIYDKNSGVYLLLIFSRFARVLGYKLRSYMSFHFRNE